MSTDIRQYIIEGRVQGVGFRAATQHTAQRLALAGWVRNCRDGRVEVLAAGEPRSLDALEQWLKQGPPPSRVDSVEPVSVAADAERPQPFAIR